MSDIQNYASFVVAVLVFQAVPGPGTVAILNATARGGVAAGFGAVAGTLLGDLVFMLAAVAGLGALIKTLPGAWNALQWLGAAYLIWLGLTLLRDRHRPTRVADVAQSVLTHLAACRQALLVGFTNPKAILFFMAFFPLFLRPGAPAVTLVLLMAHVSALCFAYQSLLVMIGNAAAQHLRRWPALGHGVTLLAGMSMIGFGLRLAWQTA
jgi:threonine/homoserine/homoserine lactone efflux protein